ncbi:probable G-protein coupled receptor 139 [Carcharodon carcharias]|uniref:probable G-protein coupled receptor 139 n=1 Tax=Carcharodon carcharias TaxID=13397 RepID=UPI001B7DAE80|nr:probable G-protein coupled receptor 139 [Carcharodon carcharias]
MIQPTIVQVTDIYFPILAAFGIPANLMTIVTLYRGNCGLSKCISFYMVSMATADLLVMLNNVFVHKILGVHFPQIILSYTPICKFIMYTINTHLYLSVWFTVSFTFDRFVSICIYKFKTKYCLVRTAATVQTTICALSLLVNMPYWFAFEPKRTLNNVQWGFQPSLEFYTSPFGAVFTWLQSILLNWVPFSLILLVNSLTVRRVLLASRAHKELRGQSRENQSDPEIQNRRKSIILLCIVSVSFILLWLTAVVCSLVRGVVIHVRPDYTTPEYIATQTGQMLMYLSSCTNTVIYAATQTKFREELKKIARFPWTLILILIKNAK